MSDQPAEHADEEAAQLKERLDQAHANGQVTMQPQRAVRYWVPVSEGMLGKLADSGWLPDGLRVIEPGPGDSEPGIPPQPYDAWRLIEDDGAPASLDGKQVELTFVRSGDKTMIGSRRPHI